MLEKKERLKKAVEYLKSKGLIHTQKNIAEKMKASSSNVSSALKGEESVLTDNFLRRFNEAFNNIFMIEWLLNGDGRMLQYSNEIEYNTKDNNIILSREVFEQISRLTETILSQQRTIESMQEERKKMLVQMEQSVICADVSGSDISTTNTKSLNIK